MSEIPDIPTAPQGPDVDAILRTLRFTVNIDGRAELSSKECATLLAALAAEKEAHARTRLELDYDPDDPNWGSKDRSRAQLRRVVRKQHKTHHEMFLTIKLLGDRLAAAESILAAALADRDRLAEAAQLLRWYVDAELVEAGDEFGAWDDEVREFVAVLATPQAPTEGADE